MALSPKQEIFCKEYLIDLNATQAAIRAGYSKKTANEQASRMLANVNISNRISGLMKQRSDEVGITSEQVLSELASLSFWSIQDFIGEGNSILDISKISREKSKPVVGIKRTEKIMGSVTIIETELKMVNKHGALVDIGRHLGLFEKDNSQKKTDVTVNIQ